MSWDAPDLDEDAKWAPYASGKPKLPCVVCQDEPAAFVNGCCWDHVNADKYREPWWLRALRWVVR